MRVVKRPAFLRDVTRYAIYIANDNPDAAERFIIAAEQTCDLLCRQPALGHAEKFRKLIGVRSFRVSGFDNYLIFYCESSDSVEFLRLIHGARDLPRVFKR
jgi:toxin ParE1/3/4